MDDPHDAEVAGRLRSARPVPRPGFRGELRRTLLADARAQPPARLRLWIGAYALSGVLLLSAVGAGIAGAGPLAP